MKKMLSMLVFGSLFICGSVAQNTEKINEYFMLPYKVDMDTGYFYHVYDEAASPMLEALLNTNGKRPGKKHTHRFRSQRIRGLDRPVRFVVYQGIEKPSRSDQYVIGESVKFSEVDLATLPDNQRLCLTIYFKNNSRFRWAEAIESKEESELVLQHLAGLVE